MQKLYFEHALLPAGWAERVELTVEDGRFTAVVPDSVHDNNAERIKGIALPGVGNLHSHTFQRGFAGMAERRGLEDDHFWSWREAMYAFVGVLTPDDVEAIAAMAFVEMIESGFTAVAEFHYLHHAPDGQPYADPGEVSWRIVAAAATAGIGLTLLPVFYAHGNFGGEVPSTGQRRFVCDLDLFARLHASAGAAVATLPAAGIGIAPHSLRAVTEEEFVSLLSTYSNGPVHLHIAEQDREVSDCLASTGLRPVDWLLSRFPVDDRWCLIHATHMTADETLSVARTRAVAGLCPVTESNLGDGIFPAVGYAARGGRYGVGSDSNVAISLRDELRTLCYSQRLRDRARNRLATPERSSGRTLFDAAARGGAQALALPIGALAPGFRADIVVLDENHVALTGKSGDAILDAWVFATVDSPVAAVMANGTWCVTAGRHHARDAVATSFRRTLARLRA